ncbi:MAG: nitrous oxide-stimulated promoter family protein [Bacteroides sp.]|nr:nitrous oxide-stimulated promoter family protein [Bacteroides sp.]
MEKITAEKATVEKMIALYCRHRHREATLCDVCRELVAYAHQRLDRCQFGEKKPKCSRCTVHCYKPEMRTRIREVMCFSGPRILFYDPVSFFRHLFGG